MLLAGDVGGTKVRLALYDGNEPRRPLAEASYPSSTYSGLEEVCVDFLTRCKASPTRAVFGLAGPVNDGNCRITNLPWEMSEQWISGALGIPSVTFLNDLQATAYGIFTLHINEMKSLHSAHIDPYGIISVVAPGTGLGKGFMVYNGTRYHAFPSEGGHVGFAPQNDIQRELLAYLAANGAPVSLETVCSGIGIQNIYRFLKELGKEQEPEWLKKELKTTRDPVPVIVQSGLAEDTPITRRTLEMVTEILAAALTATAVELCPTGGIYLCGGLTPRLQPLLSRPEFLVNYLNSTDMLSVPKRIPLTIVTNPDTALLGAAYFGMLEKE